MCQGYGILGQIWTEYFSQNEVHSSLKVLAKLPNDTDSLDSLGVLVRCNGIKGPSSQNPLLSVYLTRKMSEPCLQLNSKVIRDKAECHIITAIEKKCSVVAFKCVWRVHDDEIEWAWNWICEKRDKCDLTLSKLSEVCFFFSAISTSKLDSKKKTSKRSQPDEARESDDSNEESQINPSQISSHGKKYFLQYHIGWRVKLRTVLQWIHSRFNALL